MARDVPLHLNLPTSLELSRLPLPHSATRLPFRVAPEALSLPLPLPLSQSLPLVLLPPRSCSMARSVRLALCAAACLTRGVSAASSGDMFAKPMRGWNSWFAFDVSNNETVMRSNADALVSLGLAALNFSFVNLDGGWQGERLPNGTLTANSTRFPSGMPTLASYIHGRGLLFGSYTDRGARTCDNHVGSGGFYGQDAALWASWPADMVKVDSCGGVQSHDGAVNQYGAMQDAIAATGRPMVFSLCGWLSWYAQGATAGNANYPRGVGSSWRIGPDALSWDNVRMNMDAAKDAAPYVRVGGYADVDEVMGPSRGRPISPAQTLTQIAFIAIVGSPMLISFDLTNLTPDDPDVAQFLNEEVLAVHWALDAPVFKQLVGGQVAADRWAPYTNLPCNASDATVLWSFLPTAPANASTNNNASVGYLVSTGSPGQCLYAGAAWTGECNNAQGVWLAQCGSKSLCCDAACTSQQVSLNEDGTITTLYWPGSSNAPGPFLTLDRGTNTVFWEERLNGTADAARQQWSFSPATGLLSNAATGLCMGARPPVDSTVWGRALENNAWAVLLINFSKAGPQAVACDAACFAAAGFAPGTTLAVRDLWARADNGTVNSSAGYSAVVPADGGSFLLSFTPV